MHFIFPFGFSFKDYNQGRSQNLKLGSEILLLVECGDSNFWLSGLIANEVFFCFFFCFFLVCLLCVHPSMDKIILLKIF